MERNTVTLKALANPRVLALLLASLFPLTMSLIFLSGVIACSRHLLRLVQFVLNLSVRRGTKLEKYGARQGAWAVVTGGSDGLGREFALQLAQRGFNVAIVSRTPSKIEKVAKEIVAQRGCETISVLQHSIDFAKAGPSEWAAVQTALAPLDIGILVNNAGLNHRAEWSRFVDAPAEECVDVVTVNTTAVVRMTRLVLPGMVSRKRGLVLNIGFLAGEMAAPMWAIYSATKAFLVSWTQSIATELEKAKTGVDAQVSIAGYVAGGMATHAKESFETPNPARWVSCALNSVGLNGGSVGFDYVSTPFWSHAAMAFIIRSLGIENIARSQMHDTLLKKMETKAKTK